MDVCKEIDIKEEENFINKRPHRAKRVLSG